MFSFEEDAKSAISVLRKMKRIIRWINNIISNRSFTLKWNAELEIIIINPAKIITYFSLTDNDFQNRLINNK